MKILVCGGRNFDDTHLLYGVMDDMYAEFDFPTPLVIIHGDAKGADRLAGQWAEEYRSLEVEVYPADWQTHGKAAGYIRNKQMLEEGKPDLVVAFPGGRGTANMVKLARNAGVKVKEITYNDN